ncbi:MAG: DUF2059 domain-containing protein [Hyphomicrobiaceae bacterium]|jgi:hypothetical protein
MLQRALLIAAFVAALLSAPASLRAQLPDPARLAAARELMEVAGVAKQFNEVMPVLAQRLGEAFVAVAPDKADEIREVFKQVAVKFVDRKGELIDQIAALYAEKLSAEDMTAIVAFYKSPVGARFIAIQPEMSRQAMTLGQRWGSAIGREIEAEARRELKKRGIEL